MAAERGYCDWARTGVARDRGNFFELHVALGEGVTRTDVEVFLNGHAVRVLRGGAAAYELRLPAEVSRERSSVRWHGRRGELRFALPWEAPARPGPAPRLASPGLGSPDGDASGLQTAGFHVIDELLGGHLGRIIAKKVISWYSDGRLAPGVVGTHARPLAPLAKVRGDFITTLKEGEDADIATLLRRFDALAVALAARLQGLRRVTQRSHAMVAVYPPGSFGYIRHVDNPGGDPADRRRLTFIYYLNFDWQPSHGGVLRLHLQNETVDVAPRGDRLACFRSDKVEHEVLPAGHAPRAAVSVWYSEEATGPDNEPERPLPVEAVHMLAAQLARGGAVRLPQWMQAAVSAEELAAAARSLVPGFLGPGVAKGTLGEHPDALSSALVALSDFSTDCYRKASAAVASCVACAERLLAMLRKSSAPGWEPSSGGTALPRKILLASYAPGTRASLMCENGSVLGCIVVLSSNWDGLVAAISANKSSHVEPFLVNTGDVLLLHPLHLGRCNWEAACSSMPAITLEVWL